MTSARAPTGSSSRSGWCPPRRCLHGPRRRVVATSWLALPGGKNIGLGRQWHGLVTVAWVANGFLYVGFMFLTGQWRRIVPTSWDVFPSAWESVKVMPGSTSRNRALHALRLPATAHVLHRRVHRGAPDVGHRPGHVSRADRPAPWYAKMFGGRQAARSLHLPRRRVPDVFRLSCAEPSCFSCTPTPTCPR